MYKYIDLFVVTDLPEPLNQEELNLLIKQVRNGDAEAREKLHFIM